MAFGIAVDARAGGHALLSQRRQLRMLLLMKAALQVGTSVAAGATLAALLGAANGLCGTLAGRHKRRGELFVHRALLNRMPIVALGLRHRACVGRRAMPFWGRSGVQAPACRCNASERRARAGVQSQTSQHGKPLASTFVHRRAGQHRNVDTLGVEPRAFRMRSGCDTTTPCAPARLLLRAPLGVQLRPLRMRSRT